MTTATNTDPAAEFVRLVRAAPDGSIGAILAPSPARALAMVEVVVGLAGLQHDRRDGWGVLDLEGGRTIRVGVQGRGLRGYGVVALWACESMHQIDIDAALPALAPSGKLLR